MANKSEVQYIRYYTAGSAARELAPLVSPKPKAMPKPRKQKRIIVHIDPIAILGVVTALVMVCVMVFGLIRLNQAQERAAAMNAYVQQLTAENAAMEQQYAQGYDLEDVEKTALALGMVPADQVSHVQLGN